MAVSNKCCAMALAEGCVVVVGATAMATSPIQTSQLEPREGSEDDAMRGPDDGASGWTSESDGLVEEEAMEGVEDLWNEHLLCVHTYGRHKCVPSPVLKERIPLWDF